MSPLLIDFKAAREAKPALHLPAQANYPGGEVRVRAHIQAALDSHASHFGSRPAGFWPAEGGVSDAVLQLFAEAGLKWAASGEGVLRHSLAAAKVDLADKAQWAYRPYRVNGGDTVCFFRDDRLSDLIGFEYNDRWGNDAVRHFLHQLDAIRLELAGREAVVTVILDGENAWE